MYGMIHKAARAFTIREHGEKRWDAIMSSQNLSDEIFISGRHFSDTKTVALIGAIASELEVDIDDLLSGFGRYWIAFTANDDYGPALEMCGDDPLTFFHNLDDLHRGIKTALPDARLPAFRVLHGDAERIELLYQSEREGLASFVTGLIEGVLNRFSQTGVVTWEQAPDGLIFSIQRTNAG